MNGQYQISATNSKGIQLGLVSFKLNAQSDIEKSVPAWVKNTAGWWAADKILDLEFVSALQFLINEGIIKVEQKFENDASFAPKVSEYLITYQTKIPFYVEDGTYSVILVHATHNDYCSEEERKISTYYGKMAESKLKPKFLWTDGKWKEKTDYCSKKKRV